MRRTLWAGAALSVAGLVGRRLAGRTIDSQTASQLRVLSTKEYAILEAACRRLLAPDEPDAPLVEDTKVVLAIDRYLATLDGALASDVRSLLHLLEHTTFALGYLGRFTSLGPKAQDEVLEAWERSRFDLAQQGFHALKSLALLGYYGDSRTFPILHYSGPMVGVRL